MDQYYKVLGLDSNATKEEIKSSYRKMTKKHHPDLNPNDKNSEEKFKKVVEAYEFLTGKQKTKPQQPQGNPFGGGGNPFGGGRNPFGGGMRRGKTIIHILVVTLEEAFSGISKEITIPKKVVCNSCSGTGGINPQTCNQCNGAGATHRGNTIFMCNNCAGKGILYVNRCNSCGGVGAKLENKSFNITLPPGISNDAKILKQGYGNEVNNGMAGDILINVKITPHPLFTVEGLDLKSTVIVPILEIFLGTDINFITLDGNVKINVPRMSDANKVLRLKHKGMKLNNGERGDLYVTLKPKFPNQITPQEESLLNTLKTSTNFT